MCGDPIGKQDQFAAAYGGFNHFKFSKDGVVVEPIELPKSLVHQLSASLVSVYTGGSRGASDLLKEQSEQIRDVQKSKVQAEMVDLVGEGIKHFTEKDLKILVS